MQRTFATLVGCDSWRGFYSIMAPVVSVRLLRNCYTAVYNEATRKPFHILIVEPRSTPPAHYTSAAHCARRRTAAILRLSPGPGYVPRPHARLLHRGTSSYIICLLFSPFVVFQQLRWTEITPSLGNYQNKYDLRFGLEIQLDLGNMANVMGWNSTKLAAIALKPCVYILYSLIYLFIKFHNNRSTLSYTFPL